MHGKDKPSKEKESGSISMVDLATTVASNWRSVDPSIKRYVVEVSLMVKKRRDQLRSSLADDSVDEEEASTTNEDVSFNGSEGAPSIITLEDMAKMQAVNAQPFPTLYRTAPSQDNYLQFHNITPASPLMNVNNYGTMFSPPAAAMGQMMRTSSNATSMMGFDNTSAFLQPNNCIQGFHQLNGQAMLFSANSSLNQGHVGMFNNAALNHSGGFNSQAFMQPAMNNNNLAFGFYPRRVSLPASTLDHHALHCSQQRRFSDMQPSQNVIDMGISQVASPHGLMAEPFAGIPAQAAPRMDVNNDAFFSLRSNHQPRKSLYHVAAQQVPEQPVKANVTIEDFAGVKAWTEQLLAEDHPIQDSNGQSSESNEAEAASNEGECSGKEIKEVEITEEEVIKIFKSC